MLVLPSLAVGENANLVGSQNYKKEVLEFSLTEVPASPATIHFDLELQERSVCAITYRATTISLGGVLLAEIDQGGLGVLIRYRGQIPEKALARLKITGNKLEVAVGSCAKGWDKVRSLTNLVITQATQAVVAKQ